jgi:hypothetical protein
MTTGSIAGASNTLTVRGKPNHAAQPALTTVSEKHRPFMGLAGKSLGPVGTNGAS